MSGYDISPRPPKSRASTWMMAIALFAYLSRDSDQMPVSPLVDAPAMMLVIFGQPGSRFSRGPGAPHRQLDQESPMTRPPTHAV
jgi:hypothetical protein